MDVEPDQSETGRSLRGVVSATALFGRTNEGYVMERILRLILSILMPPVGVLVTVGFGGQFWLNVLLTLLGYVPGVVHAIWIISHRPAINAARQA